MAESAEAPVYDMDHHCKMYCRGIRMVEEEKFEEAANFATGLLTEKFVPLYWQIRYNLLLCACKPKGHPYFEAAGTAYHLAMGQSQDQGGCEALAAAADDLRWIESMKLYTAKYTPPYQIPDIRNRLINGRAGVEGCSFAKVQIKNQKDADGEEHVVTAPQPPNILESKEENSEQS